MVVIRQLQQGDVGGPLEQALQHRQQAGDGHAREQAREKAGGHLPEHNGEGQLVGEADEQREAGDGEAAQAGRAHDPAALADGAAGEDADHRREESDDEQVEPVPVDDAGENRDEQRHEDRRTRIDEDGDDQRRERGRRDIRQEGRRGDVLHEERQLADPVGGAHQREVEDDHEGEQGEAAVAAHGLGILEPDVEHRGHHHGEHEEDAAEELQALVEGHVAVVQEKLAVRDEHLVLLGRDAGAGLDDRLAPFDRDGDGPEVGEHLLLEALGGLAVVEEVGRDAVAEEAEERERALAAHALGGEVDAQESERLLQRLHAHPGDLARGTAHAEKRDAVGRAGGKRAAVVVHALAVDFAQGRQAVFNEGKARLGVTEREQRGHVVGSDAVGALGVEHLDDGGELRGAPGRGGERALHAGGGDGVGGIVALELLQGGEQLAEVGLELLQRAELELVDGRHAVEELGAAELGLEPAFVAEGRARDDAHHGELVLQHGQRGRRNPDETDEHDSRDRGHENQERHRCALLQIVRGGGCVHGLAPAPGRGGGTAAEELELGKKRHGTGGGSRLGLLLLLVTGGDGVPEAVVGLDDLLDKRGAHNVGAGEVVEVDAGDAAQDVLDLQQA